MKFKMQDEKDNNYFFITKLDSGYKRVEARYREERYLSQPRK